MLAPSSHKLDKQDVIESVHSAVYEIWGHMQEKEEEVAGAVFKDGTIHRFDNIHPSPKTHFHVDASQSAGLENVVAIYHSHPNGNELISVTDMRGLAPIPAVIVTSLGIILWWPHSKVGYYRIWDWYGPE